MPFFSGLLLTHGLVQQQKAGFVGSFSRFDFSAGEAAHAKLGPFLLPVLRIALIQNGG